METSGLAVMGAVILHVLVFTKDGQFLREIGLPGEPTDSNSTEHFSRVAEIAIDSGANEAYFADGYGNKRVAVVDAATGAFKRYWGAYGNRPSDDRVTYTLESLCLNNL